ncbi:thiamine pyrophosphate-dependent dehydrogenase E1 component subunit alpha [Deinococcus sonorensis]|uniref:2-oxoisovalerate dehydrogenase subunit alpha n=2 Tax=Deinococcus sonorensis TaxID=309891 RepID=A0AAU7UDS2_9DEIO
MIHPLPTPVQYLGEDGSVRPGVTLPGTPDDWYALWHTMLLVREYDRKLVTLLRQGRTTFYAQAAGMEATQVGIGRALRPGHDWVWGYYRDQGIALTMGARLQDLAAQMLGSNSDPNRGRQMPHHYGSAQINFVSASSSIANQVPPATGTALAQKMLGTDEVTVCTFGDGATSEGDWHAGLNMAGVQQVPCVFVCENNQWAISTPLSRQTASDGIVAKAAGYGMPGVQVDGNDVLAVWAVVQEAVDRARRGGGPTLVEALTYRMGAHSNADADAEKTYRSREEVQHWQARDPLVRFERFLERQGHSISAAQRSEAVASLHRQIDEAIQEAENSGQPDWRSMFEDVYADMPVHLRRQYQQLRLEQEAGQS